MKRRPLGPLHLLAFVAISCIGRSVTPVDPVAASPSGTLIAQRTDTLTISIVNGGDTTHAGLAIDRVFRGTLDDGREIISRIFETNSPLLGVSRQRMVDLVDSLRPVRHFVRSPARIAELEFDGVEVRGWTRAIDGGDRREIVDFIAPGVINSASFDLFVRSMELELGSSASIAAYNGRTSTIDRLTATVTHRVFWSMVGESVSFVESEVNDFQTTFVVGTVTRRLWGFWIDIPAIGRVVYRSLEVPDLPNPYTELRPAKLHDHSRSAPTVVT